MPCSDGATDSSPARSTANVSHGDHVAGVPRVAIVVDVRWTAPKSSLAEHSKPLAPDTSEKARILRSASGPLQLPLPVALSEDSKPMASAV